MSKQKSAHPFTPVVVCKVLRQMGLISNHDNGYFEAALVAYLNHGDIGKAAKEASDARDAERDREYAEQEGFDELFGASYTCKRCGTTTNRRNGEHYCHKRG